MFARHEPRLLTDDALAAHLLHLAVRVGDDPVAGEQLGRDGAHVADSYRISEHVPAGVRLGLVGDVHALYRNFESVVRAFRYHAAHLN